MVEDWPQYSVPTDPAPDWFDFDAFDVTGTWTLVVAPQEDVTGVQSMVLGQIPADPAPRVDPAVRRGRHVRLRDRGAAQRSGGGWYETSHPPPAPVAPGGCTWTGPGRGLGHLHASLLP
jgi:hypothetical protein